MSKVVDQRVVEMQFDNKQFEQNVATTMSTLDKLKQKLNMSGASKGLDDVGKAARNVNMSGLSAGVEAVTAKFSAMQVMGVTALANITNSAINAGKRVVDSLTIEPIRTGFNEYELKMDSVRTIMASTGESVETVNKYLEELNEYSDQTIYSFSDMTQNIGKFTNAGVKLEDAVMAIKGISNEAAVSGANANEASRAMYNFAQALSAGHVKLIDWKSIELANMATKEFKEQLIGSAVAAGTLTKDADGMYRTLNGNVLNATKNFNETLNDQWMTTEVLVNTLKNYADNTTDIGKKAFAAAQDVTKFTQMLDVLKETAQSGWAKTWELLFGDINQAKAIFTPLTEFFSTLINGVSDFRNNLLEGALTSPFVKLAEKITTVTDSVSGAVEVMQDYNAVVDQIIRGDFGNGQARWDALTEAGYDWAHAQNLVNERLGDSTRHVTNFAEAQSEANVVQSKTLDQLAKMSDSQLKEIGYTEDQISSLRELAKAADDAGLTISAFLDEVSKTDGRTLIIESLKNAGSGLVGVFTALKEAWIDIFPPMTSIQLYNLIAGFNKFTERLRLTDKETGELTDTAKKLQRVFRGVFAAIDIITTIVGGGLKIAFKIVSQLLAAFDMDILSVAANIGDAIVGFRDWIDSVLDFTAVFEAIAPTIKNGIDAVKDWVNKVKGSEAVRDFIQGFANGLKAGAKKVWDAFVEFGKKIVAKFNESIGVQSPSWIAFESAGDFVQGFANGIAAGIKLVLNTLGTFGKAIVDYFKTLDFSMITDSFKSMFGDTKVYLSKFDWKKLLALIPLGITAIGTKKLFDLISAFGEGINGVNDLLEGLQKIETNFSKVLKAYAMNVRAEAVQKIAISLAILVGSIVLLSYAKPDQLWDAVAIVVMLGIVLAALAWALGKLSESSTKISRDGIEFNGIKSSLVGIGLAVLLLGATAKLISTMDPEQTEYAFKQLAKIMLALVAVVAVYGIFVKGESGKYIKKAGSMMIKLAIALGLMVGVCKLINMLSPQEIATGTDAILKFAALTSGLAIIARIGGKSVSKLGGMMLKISFAMLLMISIVKLVQKLNEDEMIHAAKFAGGFAAFVGILVLVTKIGRAQQIAKLGGLLLSVSISMALMIGVCKLAGMLTDGDLKNGAYVAAGFLVFVGVLVSITKISNEEQMGKVAGTIIATSIAIGLLAGIAVLLGMVPTDMLIKGTAAVVALGGIMTAMIWATRGAGKCVGNIVAMAFAIGIMAASIVVLSYIDENKLSNATLALGTLLLAFVLVLKVAGDMGRVTATLIVMTIAVGLLGGILYMLGQNDPMSNIGAAGALSIVMLALAGALRIIAGMRDISTKAIVAMGVVSLAVLAIGGVLYLLRNNDPSQSLGIAIVLSVFLYALLGAIAIMQFLKGPSAKGLIALGIVTLVIGALAYILYQLREVDPEQAIGVVKAIAVFLGAMLIACLAAALIGNPAVAGPALIGLGILVAFIGLLGLVVIGLAELAMDVIAGMPKLGKDLSDFMTNVQGFLDGVQNIPDNISDKIGKLSGAILKLTGADFLKSIADFLKGGSGISKLGSELKSFGEDIGSFAVNANKIDSAVTSLSKLDNLTDTIENINLSGLSGLGTTLGKESVEIVKSIVSTIENRDVEFSKIGKHLIDTFCNGVLSMLPKVVNTTKNVALQAAIPMRSSYQSFYSIGSYLVDGFAAGISANTFKAEAKAAAMAKAAAEAAEEALEINSPSKVFTKMGMFVPEGFAIGIDKLRNVVVASAVAMANAPLDSVKEAIAGISNAIDSDIDTQPTIRPVIDLSDVRTGTAAINGLFSSSVGTLSAAGNINMMMNRRNQNGANSDVVSAIDKLNKKLDNAGNTYNSINGINISGDSDLDDAFQTIVRYAKIERRV